MANPLNATFFAFKKRERGGVLTGLTIIFVLFYIAAIGAFGYFNWHAAVDYMSWAASLKDSGMTPGEPFPMPPASVMAVGPSYFLLLLVIYIVTAAYEAGCLRWMIHGETGGILGLSFGADTWRVYFSYWLWLILFFAFYLVCALVIGGVSIALMASGGAQDPSTMMPLVFAAPFLFLLALIFFGVRFAPAAATSVARRRFAFFDAWKVTRGRFWALFGSFVLLFLMYFVAIIIFAVLMGLGMGLGMGGVFNAAGAEPSSEDILRTLSDPKILVPLLVGYGGIIVVAFVFVVALFGVNARAAAAALEEGKIQAAS